MDSPRPHILLSNELVPYCLREVDADYAAVDQALDEMSEDEFDAYKQFLIEILLSEDVRGRVRVIDPTTRQRKTFHSIIEGGPGSTKDRLVAFNFSDAALDSVFPVGGLLVGAAVTGGLSLVDLPMAAQIVQTLWTNFTVLRLPQDTDAISVARSVAGLAVRHRRNGDGAKPSNCDLLASTGLSQEKLVAAIKKLDDLKVLKCAGWGGESLDYSHPDNRWTVRV